MKTLEYLADPMLRGLYLPAILAGLAVAVTCSLVSVLVVVKRLGFVGQGISHSAFGGIGVASLLAAYGVLETGGAAEMLVVGLFCIGAAVGMALVGRDRKTPEDTAIGLFLVASMALGAILVQVARQHAIEAGRPADVRSWESILFGSVLLVSRAEVVAAWVVLVGVAASLWAARRPLLLWAFDEDAARAAGVPTGLVRAGLLAVLAVVVVTTMKVAGVVLASALIVLPGATALRLSTRLRPVLALSVAAAVLGLVLGLVLSFELSWQPGPCIALAQTGLFVLAALAGARRAG
ncbi:MAG: metal ABC transporter permease [Phycisphaerales bacterium]